MSATDVLRCKPCEHHHPQSFLFIGLDIFAPRVLHMMATVVYCSTFQSTYNHTEYTPEDIARSFIWF